jgi:hypothetical protein
MKALWITLLTLGLGILLMAVLVTLAPPAPPAPPTLQPGWTPAHDAAVNRLVLGCAVVAGVELREGARITAPQMHAMTDCVDRQRTH